MSTDRLLRVGERARITAPADSPYIGRTGVVEMIQGDLVAVFLDGSPPQHPIDRVPKPRREVGQPVVGVGIFVERHEVDRIDGGSARSSATRARDATGSG